jgi:hypothetical protein
VTTLDELGRTLAIFQPDPSTAAPSAKTVIMLGKFRRKIYPLQGLLRLPRAPASPGCDKFSRKKALARGKKMCKCSYLMFESWKLETAKTLEI